MNDPSPAQRDDGLVGASPPAQPRPRSQRRRVLVAEDDDAMRALVVETVRRQGHTVLDANDAPALRAATMGPDIEAVWDLIVSDIRLPSGDGLLVLEALRRAGCGAPMIVMTAFGDEATRRRVEGLGGVLLEKPFPLEELTTAIDHLLFGTARRQQVGPP